MLKEKQMKLSYLIKQLLACQQLNPNQDPDVQIFTRNNNTGIAEVILGSSHKVLIVEEDNGPNGLCEECLETHYDCECDNSEAYDNHL